MTRLSLAVAFCLAAVLAAAGFGRPAVAAPAVAGPLPATTHVTYDVRPDRGPVTVSWQVDLRNNDPETVYNEFGTSYFYTGYPVPALRGASSFVATGPGGGGLAVEVRDYTSGPVVAAFVNFDRGLFYGDRYSFTLSYELTSARLENLLVTPAYVFLPAVATGDAATVTVRTPEAAEWQSSLSPLDCGEEASGEFHCAAPDDIVVGAMIEVLRSDALQTKALMVELSAPSRQVPVELRFFPGEDGWARHVEELARPSLLAMSGLLSLRTGDSVLVTERGRTEIAGFGGRAGCLLAVARCVVELSPFLDDLGILHEFAHLWTPANSDAWIAEGMAEWMAHLTAEALNLPATRPAVERTALGRPLYLDEWDPGSSLLAAGHEQLAEVYAGYEATFQLFEQLEARIGDEDLRRAFQGVVLHEQDLDSEHFLDSLETVSEGRVDDLFRQSVFPPSFAATLDMRRRARDRFALLTAASHAQGLDLPGRVELAVDEWNFVAVLDELDRAEAALSTYAAAGEALERPRSLLQRFGMVNRDPDGLLDQAVKAFSEGQYDDASAIAGEAKARLDESETVAAYRIAVATGMFLLVVGGFALAFVLGRRAKGRLDAAAVLTSTEGGAKVET